MSSNKTELKSTLLALDIGSEFVKCALATPVNPDKPEKALKFKDTLKSGKLKLLGFSKARQTPGNMSGGAISDIPGVVASCEEALSNLEEKTGERAKTVVVGISGELVKGNTTTIRYRRDTPNKSITEAELKELLEKIEAHAEEKVKTELSLETDNPEVELSLINSALVSLSIDGYKINNPVGFRGGEVLIEYYTAFAPAIAISAIEKVCVELELDLLAVVVEPFAVCRACLGDEVDVDFSAILMDIGGGTTDIAVVDCGGICGTKMFNIAGQAFTRQVSESLGVRLETAEKYKVNLENEDILSDTLINKTTGVLNRSLSVWLAGVALALEDFKNVSPLPSDIFLSGGSSALLPLEEALATSDWYKSLPFERRPLVHLLDPFSLPDFIFPEEKEAELSLDSSFITSLGLLRVAVDTLLAAPEAKGLKAKLTKLLSH
ncbi:rod shape-determining protein [Candidatus Saccharibacteria bacterium]|nr:rod shape-determining protein [Candidatus Saccharibacteria bacterium]